MDKFKIGGQYYRIERLTDLTISTGNGGEISPYKKVIRLQDGLDAQLEKEIITHELVHGMLNMLGEHEKSQDETSVDRIAQGIIMLLVDNKEFFRQVLAE